MREFHLQLIYGGWVWGLVYLKPLYISYIYLCIYIFIYICIHIYILYKWVQWKQPHFCTIKLTDTCHGILWKRPSLTEFLDAGCRLITRWIHLMFYERGHLCVWWKFSVSISQFHYINFSIGSVVSDTTYLSIICFWHVGCLLQNITLDGR